MLTKLTPYSITHLPKTYGLNSLLSAAVFAPTESTQQKSTGFTPPKGAHNPLVEIIGGQILIQVTIETRKVPGDAMARELEARISAHTKETGRKPGRKAIAEIKDDALLSLLPRVLPKQASIPVWINPVANTVAIASTSSSQLDDVITALIRAVPDLRISPIQTAVAPSSAMAAWLVSSKYGELADEMLEVGLCCNLQRSDETKAVTKYQRQSLDRDDVRAHIDGGYMPTSLGLVFDGRVAFVLTEGMCLKSIQLLDIATDSAADQHDDQFDATFYIYTTELRSLLAHLISALGGVDTPEPTN